MNPPLTIIPVEPTGSHESVAFVNPPPPGTCGPTQVTVQDYPPSPCGEALLLTRLGLNLGLRDVAKVLGITAERASALERGRATLSADDWLRAWCELAGPGRYGFAPYANPQVTGAIARGFDAVLAVFEANARALASTAIPFELHAALARGLCPVTPFPSITTDSNATTTEDSAR